MNIIHCNNPQENPLPAWMGNPKMASTLILKQSGGRMVPQGMALPQEQASFFPSFYQPNQNVQ